MYTEIFTQKLFRRRCFCPFKLLQTGAFCKKTFTCRSFMCFFSASADIFAHRHLIQKPLKRRRFCRQKVLDTGAFLQRNFRCSYTNTFTHGSFKTKPFRRRCLDKSFKNFFFADNFLHSIVYQRSFYTRRHFCAQKLLHTIP